MTKILTAPNPMLREISKPVIKLDKKTLAVIRQLQAKLTQDDNPRGVGLSAVQLGKPIRVLCTFLPPSGNPDDKEKPILRTFINPEITKASKKLTLGPNKAKPILEGCLSVPGTWGPVWRHTWVKAKWQMENGKWKVEIFQDFPARVFQHELDHLNGILFTDHSLRDQLPLYQYQNEELVEISL